MEYNLGIHQLYKQDIVLHYHYVQKDEFLLLKVP